MSKDELQELAAGLAVCGKTLLRIADALVKQPQEVSAANEEKEPEKKLTLEDVRKAAADKSRQGYTEEVRNLIRKFGASKLSEVDVEKYPALMKDLEAIGHAK